jgi:hypothetical protein
MNRHKAALAALLASSILVVAGCGGDDEPSAPTKAEYIAEADAICRDGQAEFEAIVKDLPNSVDAPESQAAITDEIVPLYRDEIEQLRSLTPPEGDEETTAAIFDAVENGLDEVEADPSALDQAGTFEEANTLANDYGFEVCGG